MYDNYSFMVRMAEKNIQMNVQNVQTRTYCRDYMINTTDTPDITVETTEKDIVDEWKQMLSSDRYTKEFVNHLPGYYFEIFALHRLLAEKLIPYNIFVYHGSCVVMDEKAYIFSAPAGVGKSTHAGLWCRHFKDRAYILNDDKPFLKVSGNMVTAYGSPFSGKHQKHRNASAPLKAVCFLHRAAQNTIVPVDRIESLELMKEQVLKPSSLEKEEKLLSLLNDVSIRIPVFSMGCTPDEQAAEIAWKEMSKPHVW